MPFSDEAIVRALYRSVLQRDADPEGARFWAEFLAARPDEARLADLFRLFATGPEAERIGGRRAMMRALGGGEEPAGHAVGLGSHCCTAEYLRQTGLRRVSLPFDWLFAAPSVVTHCLEDDFATFLDRGQYEAVPPERRLDEQANLCEHRFYREAHGQRFLFNHHEPFRDEVHAAFVRRVERFRALCRGTERVRFYVVRKREGVNVGEFEALHRALSAYAVNFRLDFVVALPASPGRVFPGFETPVALENGVLHVISPTSDLGAAGFADPVDDLPILRLMLLGDKGPRAKMHSYI